MDTSLPKHEFPRQPHMPPLGEGLYGDKEKQQALNILKEAGENLKNGWKKEAAIREFENHLRAFKLDDTYLLQELENSMGNLFEAEILEEILSKRIINLKENNVQNSYLKTGFGVDGEKYLTPKEIASRKLQVENLIKHFREAQEIIPGNVKKTELREKALKELEFHLGELQGIKGKDEDLDKGIKKLEVIEEYIRHL